MKEYFKEGLNEKNKYKKKKTKNSKLANHYKKWLVFFMFGILTFIVSSFVIGKNYDYTPSEVGDTRSLASDIPIQLVKKQWNKKSGLLQIDLEILTDIGNERLENIEIEEVFAAYIQNPKDEITTELIQVSPNYYVVLIHDIPEKFNILGLGMKPKYKQVEIEDSDGEAMLDRVVQFYLYEETMKESQELVIQERNNYQVDWIEYQKEKIVKEVEELENESRLSKIRINNLEETLEKMPSDYRFMTEEEEKEYKNNIERLEQKIKFEEDKLEEIEEKIEGKELRIDLYDKEKEEIPNLKENKE